METQKFIPLFTRLTIACAAVSVGLVSCNVDHSDSTSDAATREPSGLLSDWNGQWKSAASLYLADGTEPLIASMKEARPEYEEEEIRDFIVSAVDVEYDKLRIEGARVTFSKQETVLCAGTYAAYEGEGDHDSHQPGIVHAELEREEEGDCAEYLSLSFSAVKEADPELHFHLIHGDEDGPMHPAPWNPAVWTDTTTPSWLADYFEPGASRLAQALPKK